MTGIEKSRLLKSLEQGEITKEMSKKDIYIQVILNAIKNDKSTIDKIKKFIKSM